MSFGCGLPGLLKNGKEGILEIMRRQLKERGNIGLGTWRQGLKRLLEPVRESLSMKISVILGTRPEAIKLAPVVLEFVREPDIDCRICVTGQHREMLDQVLNIFDLIPDNDLNLMQHNQTLPGFTALAIEALDHYLLNEKHDLVLLQGDTTSAFCAALAAIYNRIPIGHIEAGLRTWNLESPWPEEANRVLISRLASLHFPPTKIARDNLLHEGVPDDTITVTGNTVIDALYLALEKIKERPPEIPGLPDFLQPRRETNTPHFPVVLITGHRRESFGQGFENICNAIKDLSQRFPDTHFIYPVHLNPNVREPVMRILCTSDKSKMDSVKKDGLESISRNGNIHLIDPFSYL